MEQESIVSIRNLEKSFPIGKSQFTALQGIDLDIQKGEFLGLIGPSGSGKTTLLNIIGSLDVPTIGKAIVLGKSISDLSHAEAALLRKNHMGFIFQSYNLLQVHTVFENIELPLLLLHIPKKQRVQMVGDALEWVGLSSKRDSKPAQLSGGECQRVAIARAMVKRPSIVLADEPTANLDANNSHIVLQTMQTLNKELQTTFLFATHDEKVIQYLHRKIFLADGKIVKQEYVHHE